MKNESTWINLDKIPEKAVGFVYRINELDTGKCYIGIKGFYENRTLKPLKGRSKAEKERISKLKTKDNKRHRKFESDWKTYNTSNREMQEKLVVNPNNYEKCVERVCYSISEMKAWEAYLQLQIYIDGDWNTLYNEMINLRLRLRK